MNRSKRLQAGFSVGVVLLILVLLATLAVASAGMGFINLRQLTKTTRSEIMAHEADGGLHELMDRLYSNETYAQPGNGTFTTSVGAVNYRWTFDTSSPGPYSTNNLRGTTTLTGWGGNRVPAATALLVVTAGTGNLNEATVAAIVTNNYPYTVACDGQLRVGDVLASSGPSESNVRSNKTGGQPNISAGNVAGQTFSCDGPGSIQVSGSGVQNYYEPAIGLPNIPIAAIVDSFSPGGINGQHPYGGPATYIFNQGVTATTDSDGYVYINDTKIGPVCSVYVKNDLLFSGNATLAMGIHFFVGGNIQANGSLTQIAAKEWKNPSAPGHRVSPLLSNENSFLVAAGTITLNGGSASRLNILAGNGIQQNGGSTWDGLMYTQNGSITLTGTSTLTGVVIARGGDLSASGLNVTADPNVIRELTALGYSVNGLVRARTWFRP